MFHFAQNEFNFKPTKFNTVEEIYIAYDLNGIYDEEGLAKELKKYNNVYALLCPFAYSMSSGEETEDRKLIWDITIEGAKTQYYDQAENV